MHAYTARKRDRRNSYRGRRRRRVREAASDRGEGGYDGDDRYNGRAAVHRGGQHAAQSASTKRACSSRRRIDTGADGDGDKAGESDWQRYRDLHAQHSRADEGRTVTGVKVVDVIVLSTTEDDSDVEVAKSVVVVGTQAILIVAREQQRSI